MQSSRLDVWGYIPVIFENASQLQKKH